MIDEGNFGAKFWQRNLAMELQFVPKMKDLMTKNNFVKEYTLSIPNLESHSGNNSLRGQKNSRITFHNCP